MPKLKVTLTAQVLIVIGAIVWIGVSLFYPKNKIGKCIHGVNHICTRDYCKVDYIGEIHPVPVKCMANPPE